MQSLAEMNLKAECVVDMLWQGLSSSFPWRTYAGNDIILDPNLAV